MFKVDPDMIYTIADLSEISGFSKAAIGNWNLPTRKGPGGQMISGRAILEFFSPDPDEDEEKPINNKLEKKLKAVGI